MRTPPIFYSPAMAAALDDIDARCGPYAVHDRFKRQCHRMIRRGAGHPEVRARYGARAAMLSDLLNSGARRRGACIDLGEPRLTCDQEPEQGVQLSRPEPIDTAIAAVERQYRDERRAFRLASALGCATRLSLDVLAELRLILRWLRRNEYRTQLPAILNVVIACGEFDAALDRVRARP